MSCVPSEDSDQPGHPPSLIRVFLVCMKTAWVLSYPLNRQQRLWSDWADAQADLSLQWAHSHFVGFVMRQLIFRICLVLTCRCVPNLERTICMTENRNKPYHEIMVLYRLRKLILQTRVRSHPVRLDVWFLVGPSVYFYTSCARTAKALARLRWCAGSPEPLLVAYVISTIISWAGSNKYRIINSVFPL